MKNRLLLLIIILSFALALAACGSSSSVYLPPPVELGDVQPLFAENGGSWNDYVRGGNIGNATDIACDTATDTACTHAGEVRKAEINNLSSCTGVTATDSLGAFEWFCDDSSGTATVISNGLASGKGLRDLIDFAAPGWKDNSVTVNRDGEQLDITNSAVWWDNPVVANTTGGTLGSEGTVYIINSSADGIAYDILANSVSLVAAPGVIINGPVSGDIIIDAYGKDYLWVEGMIINGAGDNICVEFWIVSFSTLRNLTTNYASTGIYLDEATHNRLSGLITNNNDWGLYIYSSADNTLTDVTADGNGTNGVYLESDSSNNTLTGITVGNSGSDGIYLYSSSNNNTLTSIASSNNTQRGIHIFSSSNNTLAGVTARSNGHIGVSISSSSNNNTLTGVTAANNTSDGVYIYSSSNNIISDITAGNNALNGVYLSSVTNSTLTSITASNNSQRGVYIYSSSDNTLAGITAGNNASDGVCLFSATNNTLTGVTAGNNGANGIYLSSASDNTLSDIAAGNNSSNGVRLNASPNNTLSGIAASNNVFGVRVESSSSDNYFTGPLKLGNNSSGNCFVSGGTNPGLVDGTCTSSGLTDSYDYGLGNSSDALLTNSVIVNASSFFIANITGGDSVNTSDTGGTALYDDITDWLSFANPYRGWGIWNADAFPSSTHQGNCVTGHLCQIWDWSALASDTVIVDSLSYPDTGDIANTVTHLWSAADVSACSDIAGATWGPACSLPGYRDQGTCEAASGDWTTDKCSSSFLRNAVETSDDSIGNDNTLCESGETCLYTPNMGSYQGHGAIVNSVPAFSVGAVLSGITLKQYEANGY